MRIAAALLLMTGACAGDDGGQRITRVELFHRGLLVSINHEGRGQFSLATSPTQQQTGDFQIEPAKFQKLLSSLEKYRAQAGPTKEIQSAYGTFRCPAHLPYHTDGGAIAVQWIGPSTDQYYIVNRGCDYVRRSRSDQELEDIIMSFPVPEPDLLP